MISIGESDLAEARRLNRRQSKFPRFGGRRRLSRVLIQSLLRLSQLGHDRRVRKAGLAVEVRQAGTGAETVHVRVLRPANPVRGVVLDIHGGGWIIGNARMDDALNIALAQACDVAVVSVDYRLVGLTPIEGLMDDCLAAARWLLGQGMPEYRDLPIFFLGESAGAHLAAATLLRLKQWPELLRRVTGAVLYYGVYDLAGSDSVRRAGPDTLVLNGPGMVAGLRRLTPGMSDTARRQPPLSPLYGDLRGLPPALMFVGERDPLLDDTLQMAERWRGVAEVALHRLPEAPHGFICFRTGMAAKVVAATHHWIRERLDIPGSGSRR
ncbi:alpha/beta hydrolase [Sphingobium sp.]|uniref:alpha/beta hydrolase n=1 Tax=Sphingobium sp. TaxID=1912891 RepID=UPI000DB62EE1|nr:alpha/beta hydrolase [Sphingobium sp.]PZU64009.1 MAG: esterase [Sphingobium sp.]